MAFKATFFVNGKQYKVKNYHYSGTQATDASNKPTARPEHGYIDLTIDSNDDDFLFHWFSEPQVQHNGKIVFYSSDRSSSARKVEFKKGFCVEYDEDFSDEGAVPMTIEISISVGEININGITDKKVWMQ